MQKFTASFSTSCELPDLSEDEGSLHARRAPALGGGAEGDRCVKLNYEVHGNTIPSAHAIPALPRGIPSREGRSIRR